MNQGVNILAQEFEKALSESSVFSKEANSYLALCIKEPVNCYKGSKREFEKALRESGVFSKSASVYLASHISKESNK